jgi:hypothetical protein
MASSKDTTTSRPVCKFPGCEQPAASADGPGRPAPYRDLCAHSLWALLLRQRQLAASPQRQSQIQSAVSQALQAGGLAASARQRLEQVDYLVRST